MIMYRSKLEGNVRFLPSPLSLSFSFSLFMVTHNSRQLGESNGNGIGLWLRSDLRYYSAQQLS